VDHAIKRQTIFSLYSQAGNGLESRSEIRPDG
jgi:hypothetical protein